MRQLFIVFLFSIPFILTGQTSLSENIQSKMVQLHDISLENDDFRGFEVFNEVLKDVDIVMLGEQSHGEAEVYFTKAKLIKYLHQELGFEILAMESAIKTGAEAETTIAKSIFGVWSLTEEFRPVTQYLAAQANTEQPLILKGFDGQLNGKIIEDFFWNDLELMVSQVDKELLKSEKMNHLKQSIEWITSFDFKKLKKEEAKKDTAFINQIIQSISDGCATQKCDYWKRLLTSTKYFISDIRLKTDHRDEQMALNLAWIKEQNPDKKIICWGATSHFLYDAQKVKMTKLLPKLAAKYYQKQPMMGHYVKEKYENRVYTIGFVAHEGEFGYTRNRKLPLPPENSLEFVMGQTEMNHAFLDLQNFSVAPLWSRPLGNQFMKNDISEVMDGVIFNRKMNNLRLNVPLLAKTYPENQWAKRWMEKNGDAEESE